MSATLRVDTRMFNVMTREIARSAGVPAEEVLANEVRKVLEATLKFTPTASVSSIRKNSENASFSMQPQTLYTPKRPRSGVTITQNGFIAYYLANRYPADLWARMSARRKQSLLSKLRARGLARRSWLEIANKLGLKISYPGYVGSAVASTGKTYPENTRVRLQRQTGRLQIVIENSQPTVNRIGGSAALQRAINGRYKYFLRQMELGTFKALSKIARKYPGIKVTA